MSTYFKDAPDVLGLDTAAAAEALAAARVAAAERQVQAHEFIVASGHDVVGGHPMVGSFTVDRGADADTYGPDASDT